MRWTQPFALMIGLFLIAGCMSNRPIRGYVAPEPSRTAMDFTFYDQDGREHQLCDISCGSVTVLAVVDESKGRQEQLARDLDLLAQRRAHQGVVVVFVSEAMPGADPDKVCITDTAYWPKRLTMLCDGDGRVTEGYGVSGKTELIVIDHTSRIVGRADDVAGLDPYLDRAIDRYQQASAGQWRPSDVY